MTNMKTTKNIDNTLKLTSVRLNTNVIPRIENVKQITGWSTTDFFREVIDFYLKNHTVAEKTVRVKEMVRVSA